MNAEVEVPVRFGDVVAAWVGVVRGVEVVLVKEVTPENTWWMLHETDQGLRHVYSFLSIIAACWPDMEPLYGDIDGIAVVLDDELDLVLVKETIFDKEVVVIYERNVDLPCEMWDISDEIEIFPCI